MKKKYPLILFLHGIGEKGNYNTKQPVHGRYALEHLLEYKKRLELLLPRLSNITYGNGIIWPITAPCLL